MKRDGFLSIVTNWRYWVCLPPLLLMLIIALVLLVISVVAEVSKTCADHLGEFLGNNAVAMGRWWRRVG